MKDNIEVRHRTTKKHTLSSSKSSNNNTCSPTTTEDPIARADMARALSVAPDPDLTREISEIHEATGYLLAEYDLPPKLQPFVLMLVRAAHGETGDEDLLELSDLAIGKRLFPEKGSVIEALHAQRAAYQLADGSTRRLRTKEADKAIRRKENALARSVARLRQKLRDWQKTKSLELVFAVDGVRKYLKDGGTEDIPSRYRLDILTKIAKVIEEARSSADDDAPPPSHSSAPHKRSPRQRNVGT